jgi:RNA polymerase sigma-70 factor, ECF subfamily
VIETSSRGTCRASVRGDPVEAGLPAADEIALVRRLRAGDEEAFAMLVEQLHPGMVRLALGYVPSRAVAEEVAQEAWIGLLRGLDGFEGRSSVRTWLYRIVVNRAISAGQHERKHLTVDDSEFEDDDGRFTSDGWWVTPPAHWADAAVDRIAAYDIAPRIRAVIGQLPPGQRQVVTLRDVEGLSTPRSAPSSASPTAISACCCTGHEPASALSWNEGS